MANTARGLSGAASGAALGTAFGGPGIGTAIGAGAGGLIGLFSGDDPGGQQYIDQAIQQIIAAKVPDPAQQQIELQRYQSTGRLSPQLEHTIQQDPSAFNQIVQNVKYGQAQNKALSSLQNLGEEGGMNLSDRANLQDALLTNANKDRSNRDAISDEMARRGQLGSGMAMQAQLQGAQASGDRDAQARLHALGGAQDRALQAIQGAGDLAGKLGQQDYQRQSDIASARDRINQFNTQNAQSVQQRNVAAGNAAQQYNLDKSQTLANSNVDLGNKQQMYNKELYQKQYENELGKGQAMAGVYKSGADQKNTDRARNDQMWGSGIAAAGQLGTAVSAGDRWDKFMDKWGGGQTASPASAPTSSGQPSLGVGNLASGTDWDEFMKKWKGGTT